MKNGIETPERMIAEQQKEGLVSSEMDPRTLAVACASMFNRMRRLLLLGVGREELRSRWIEIICVLFGVPRNGDTSECPKDCAECGMCTPGKQA